MAICANFTDCECFVHCSDCECFVHCSDCECFVHCSDSLTKTSKLVKDRFSASQSPSIVISDRLCGKPNGDISFGREHTMSWVRPDLWPRWTEVGAAGDRWPVKECGSWSQVSLASGCRHQRTLDNRFIIETAGWLLKETSGTGEAHWLVRGLGLAVRR